MLESPRTASMLGDAVNNELRQAQASDFPTFCFRGTDRQSGAAESSAVSSNREVPGARS